MEHVRQVELKCKRANAAKISQLTEAVEILRSRNAEILSLLESSQREYEDYRKAHESDVAQLLSENATLAKSLRETARELSRVVAERNERVKSVGSPGAPLRRSLSPVKEEFGMGMNEEDRKKALRLIGKLWLRRHYGDY
jgi:hypothetical protein